MPERASAAMGRELFLFGSLACRTGDMTLFANAINAWAARAETIVAHHQETVVSRFTRLASRWRESRGVPHSTAARMAMHPAYQEIIGMGRDALPLILAELRREVDHWFWALRAITGADPVEPGHEGDLPAMAADWLRWARQQNIS